MKYEGKNYTIEVVDNQLVISHPQGTETFDTFQELIESHPVCQKSRMALGYGPSDDQIAILCRITTRNEAGKHFTELYDADDLIALETAELIEVSRPIHEPTGIMYDRDQWTVEVTEEGLEVVQANP
jgi:hypothetical protein